jgi:hypothetical protein
MSYVGNGPEVNSYVPYVTFFSGNGACTQFQIAQPFDNALAIEVTVGGVIQTPSVSYTITDGLISFDEAPPLGDNNIVVRNIVASLVTYNTVSAGQIDPGAVGETEIATGAVTTTKIADGAVLGNKIAVNAIRGNNIVAGTITGNLIAVNQITGNLIANNAISGNNIVSPPDIFDDAFLFGGM